MSELDKILPAIAASIGSVSKLGKAEKNSHQNYKFASIDAFLEMVNPICAENGLIFHMQETGIEEFTRTGGGGPQAWFRMHYEITVYHVSGQSLPPVTRTVEVQRTGAQASGSAQSYCLKQFMRSLFMIPTGDKDDADFRDHGAGEIVKDAPAAVPSGPQPKGARKNSSAEMKRKLVELDGELADCHSLVSLEKLSTLWERGMAAHDWPNRDPDADDYETGFPKMVRDKFAAREADIMAAIETAEVRDMRPNILMAGE